MVEYLPRLLGFTALCTCIWRSGRPLRWKGAVTAVLVVTALCSLGWSEMTRTLLAFPCTAILAAEVWRLPSTARRSPVPLLAALAVLLGLLPLVGIWRQLFGAYPLPSPERELGILSCAAALLIGASAAVTLVRVLRGRYHQTKG